MRVIRRRGWRRLASGAHVYTGDEDDVDEVVLEKRAMHTTAEVDALVTKRLSELAPGMDRNQALIRHYGDEVLQDLFELYPAPESAPDREARRRPRPGGLRSDCAAGEGVAGGEAGAAERA
jgi:hypothetical protein